VRRAKAKSLVSMAGVREMWDVSRAARHDAMGGEARAVPTDQSGKLLEH
jgi:hypothetical protein